MESWKRIRELNKEEERILKRIHFHFADDLTVSQIQLFAKVFKCFINGPYVLENRHLVQLILPVECKDICELKCIANKAGYFDLFFVSTPSYDSLEYSTEFNKQIPDMRVSLDLLTLQNRYQDLRDFADAQDLNELIRSMIDSYMLSNSSIGHNLFFEDYDLGGYCFRGKVAPNISYVDIMRTLRSTVSIASENKDNKYLQIYAKYQILDFAYQCRYLSFWSCLIDVMSFPGLSQEESKVLNEIAGWFLGNLTNPYVYHLSCESSDLNGQVDVNLRESSDNTTRIKIYLTKSDDVPMLVRFDLPHKGQPYVHLNIEQGEKNLHYRLSPDVTDGSMDHVFDNLCASLRYFNYNCTFYYHSPVSKDREIIRRMPEYTAMMNLSSYMEGLAFNLSFDELSDDVVFVLKNSINTVKSLVKAEMEDIDSLSLPELYLYADMLLEKELKEK